MPDETGTEATRSDARSADDSLFGDAADNTPAAVSEETEQDDQRPAETNDDDDEATQGQEGATESGEPDTGGEANGSEDLKVVVSIKGNRATIGVRQPSSDPHIESFDDLGESGLMREVPAVVARARARWEDAPKHPAYARPAPPARRRNRRGQAAAQDAGATAEANQAQQTLRLF